MLRRFPVIVGPTAGGKSALGVLIAQMSAARGVPAEVITADSMQVYRGLDIGTAKPTEAERGGVPHRLIDLLDPAGEPAEGYTVNTWLEQAGAMIDGLRGSGRLPVVVGGTHLYVKALLEGLFEGPPADETLRAELHQLGAAGVREELERVDPGAAGRIHPNDIRRGIRAIEVYRLTGRPLSEHQAQWDTGNARGDALLVGIEWPSQAINGRINARVRSMVEAGFIEEARALFDRGALVGQAGQALGYKQLASAFRGEIDLETALERTKIETRRFAKNQRTWLRRLKSTPGSLWFEGEESSPEEIAQAVVEELFAS